MAAPVVVQGTPVNQNQAFGITGLENSRPPVAHSNNANNGNSSADRSDKVETSCNDPIFAVLFYLTLAAIVAVAALYGPDALSSTSGNSDADYTSYVIVTVIFVVVSFFGAGAGMALLFWIPQCLIKTALIFTVVMAGVWALFSFLSGSIFGGVIGLIFFALTVCYAYAVWSRIPFATANLVTACTAIRANLGVAVYAYIFAMFAGGWAVVWSLAFAGLLDKTYTCNDATGVCSDPSYGILFALFLAFFFVQQVIQVCTR